MVVVVVVSVLCLQILAYSVLTEVYMFGVEVVCEMGKREALLTTKNSLHKHID